MEWWRRSSTLVSMYISLAHDGMVVHKKVLLLLSIILVEQSSIKWGTCQSPIEQIYTCMKTFQRENVSWTLSYLFPLVFQTKKTLILPCTFFTGILAVLKDPGQEGLTSNNPFSPSISDVSKNPQKSPSHAPLLINSSDGIQAWGDADHLFSQHGHALLEY